MTKHLSLKSGILVHLTAFLFLAAFLGQAVSAGEGKVVAVQATIVDETVIVGEALSSEGETRNAGTFPAALESYQPMPIPQTPKNAGEVIVAPGENKFVVFDPETGEETITAAAFNLAAALDLFNTEANSGRPGGGGGDEITPENFTNVSRITNPSPDPWRRSGKLFFSQSGGNFVCSASTIRPNMAITAGHCVHKGRGGTWSSDVFYVPAYNNGAQPYGKARGIRLASWTGWTNSSSFNHDIGIIKLERNIGSTVGWYGIGYSSSPSFYVSAPVGNNFPLATTFNNASYPAASPFNGQFMYYRWGTFDGWYNFVLQLYFNKRSWGGQSGSSYYLLSSGSRIVHAITSNTTSSRTGAPKLDKSKFDAIVTWFSTLNTGFDLTPLFVEVDGQGKLTYLVNNNSSETWSGTVTANVYLSDNANISAADTRIQSHEFDASFTPLSSVEINVPHVAIPEGTSSGTHYVGVILDFADANPDNNDSDGQDAGVIKINN